jgi:CBS domain containing-hemolysin-like protein
MSSLGIGPAITIALVLLIANAFFVGAEFALISARRSQIEPRALGGSRMARTTLHAMENVSLVMAGAQLGITICSLGLGAVGEPAVANLIEPVLDATGVPDSLTHPIAFVIALMIVVYLHVVLGEMVPKNIALVLGPPMMALVTVLSPVIRALNAIANATLRLLRVEPKDEISSAYTREEVAALVEESRGEGMLAEEEYGRLTGALGFTEKTIADVVLPVSELETVRRGATAADVEALCAATGYSRFPVVGESGDLLGYLHIKDVLETDEDRRNRVVDDKWIRPFAPVQIGDLLHDALAQLQQRGAHMALVVDADGSVRGLATLEDVIEELVGEIRDAAHQDEPA